MANGDEVSRKLVLEQLVRLLESPVFSRSDRLGRFLRYTIERALDGASEELKEYTIGIEVYDRKPPYHPSQDSIVRTEARRLRAKLKEYYEGDGRSDSLQINYRPGSYAPVLSFVEPAASTPATQASPAATVSGIRIAVLPFRDGTGTASSAAFARSLTDELVHVVTRTEGCRAVSVSSTSQLDYAVVDFSLLRQLGADVILEGKVLERVGRMRVTFRITSAYGLIWSEKMEGRVHRSELLTLEEQMASAFMNRLAPQASGRRLRQAISPRTTIGVSPELLAAEALLDQGDRVSLESALDRFQQVERDVSDCAARAAGGIALSHCMLALTDATARDRAETAEAAARRALLQDPDLVEAQAAFGYALMLRWELDAAEAHFRRAVRRGASALTARLFGDLLLARCSFDDAEQFLRSAQRADPFSYRQKSSFFRFLYLSRRYAEALPYFADPFYYGPLPMESLYYQALILVQLGQLDAASRVALEMRRNAGGDPFVLHEAAEILALSGERRRAEDAITEFRLHANGSPIGMLRKSLLCLSLGDTDRSRSHLYSAVESKEFELIWLRADPRFDVIRDEREFRDAFASIPR